MSRENNFISHSELVELGYNWTINKCAFAFKEFKTQNFEIPDIIGFKGNFSFVLEAKCSRSDFLKDKKKSFRINPNLGMGDFRFFITPKGLLDKKELIEMNWGLLEVNENKKVRVKYNPFGKSSSNIYSRWKCITKNSEAEKKVMYSALRRLQIRKRIDEIYNPINTIQTVR